MIRELLLAHVIHSLVDAHLVTELGVSTHPSPIEDILVAQCRPHSVVESAYLVGALRVPIDQQDTVEHLRSSRDNSFRILSFLLLPHDLPRELSVKVNLLPLPAFLISISSFRLFVVRDSSRCACSVGL